MAKRKKNTRGRTKGQSNRGFWFRSSRGWYVTAGKKAIALKDANGVHLKDKDDKEAVERAYAEYVLNRDRKEAVGDSTPMIEICSRFLKHCQANNAASTFKIRADMLYDFCNGFSPRFRTNGKQPREDDRIHDGYGPLPLGELRGEHVQQWLDAHPRWKGCQYNAITSVTRAINYNLKLGLVEANPLKGFPTPKSHSRATYFTDEQEQALLENASKPVALALKVLIATGARPYSEFAALEANNVDYDGDTMIWTFTDHKTKHVAGQDRIIYVPPSVEEIVVKLMKRRPKGKLFRSGRGRPWTKRTLGEAFRRLRTKIAKQGITLDKDSCLYSCRHTFAQRAIGGHNGRPPIDLHRLAGLLGDTMETCQKHYAKWRPQYTQPLKDAVKGL